MGDTEKRVAIYTRVGTKDQTTDRSSACWARATRSSSPGSIAWSLRDLANVAYEIDEAVANLKVLEQAVDISTGAGRAFFRMLAVFAAFETDVRRERQMEGIVVTKRQGIYTGRMPSLDRERVKQLAKDGLGPARIARELGMARSSVYRLIEE